LPPEDVPELHPWPILLQRSIDGLHVGGKPALDRHGVRHYPSQQSVLHRHGWTPERRARQAEAIQRWQPWTRSTGPRTAEGKALMAMNRYQGGTRELLRTMRRLLRQPAAFVNEMRDRG
jgi:hypothetical protein